MEATAFSLSGGGSYVFIATSLLSDLSLAIAHNAIHEGVHLAAAIALGQPVAGFLFLTNGWGSSRVIYATPAPDRVGGEWLIIAWLPAVATVGIGFLLHAARHSLLSSHPVLNTLAFYGVAFFLLIDPLYFGVLSWLIRGDDTEAAAAVGWSPWAVQLPSIGLLAINSLLVYTWRRQELTQGKVAFYPRWLAKNSV